MSYAYGTVEWQDSFTQLMVDMFDVESERRGPPSDGRVHGPGGGLLTRLAQRSISKTQCGAPAARHSTSRARSSSPLIALV